MKDLVKLIVEKLVDDPKKVSVTEIEGYKITVIELSVTKEDMGKIIGKKGRNFTAIRTILKSTTRKANKRKVLVLVEQGPAESRGT